MYNFVIRFVGAIVKVLFPTKIYKRYTEPADGPLIVCANHVSLLDFFFLGLCLKRQVYFMAKQSIIKVWPLGPIAKKMGVIPVNREGSDINAIKSALRVLKAGDVLGIFPEGTRAREGKRIEVKSGIGMFIKKTGADVLPVRIIPHTKSGRVYPFRRLDVVVGDIIESKSIVSAEEKADEYGNISTYIMDTVYGLEVPGGSRK